MISNDDNYSVELRQTFYRNAGTFQYISLQNEPVWIEILSNISCNIIHFIQGHKYIEYVQNINEDSRFDNLYMEDNYNYKLCKFDICFNHSVFNKFNKFLVNGTVCYLKEFSEYKLTFYPINKKEEHAFDVYISDLQLEPKPHLQSREPVIDYRKKYWKFIFNYITPAVEIDKKTIIQEDSFHIPWNTNRRTIYKYKENLVYIHYIVNTLCEDELGNISLGIVGSSEILHITHKEAQNLEPIICRTEERFITENLPRLYPVIQQCFKRYSKCVLFYKTSNTILEQKYFEELRDCFYIRGKEDKPITTSDITNVYISIPSKIPEFDEELFDYIHTQLRAL